MQNKCKKGKNNKKTICCPANVGHSWSKYAYTCGTISLVTLFLTPAGQMSFSLFQKLGRFRRNFLGGLTFNCIVFIKQMQLQGPVVYFDQLLGTLHSKPQPNSPFFLCYCILSQDAGAKIKKTRQKVQNKGSSSTQENN